MRKFVFPPVHDDYRREIDHPAVYRAMIFLHRPRSDLVLTSVENSTSCTYVRPQNGPITACEYHTAKSTEAADKIADLTKLPGHMVKHTPFFTCMVTLGAIVQLSLYTLTVDPDRSTKSKQNLKLNVGALKTMKEVWPLADAVQAKVKGAAREAVSLKLPPSVKPMGISHAQQPLLISSTSPDAATIMQIFANDPWFVGLNESLFGEISIPDMVFQSTNP